MRQRIELSFVIDTDGPLPMKDSTPLLDAFEAVVRALYEVPEDGLVHIEADGRAKFTTLLRPKKRKTRS